MLGQYAFTLAQDTYLGTRLARDPQAPLAGAFFHDYNELNAVYYSVRAQAPHPAAAALWALWMTTPEAEAIWQPAAAASFPTDRARSTSPSAEHPANHAPVVGYLDNAQTIAYLSGNRRRRERSISRRSRRRFAVNRFVSGVALVLALIGAGLTRASLGQTDDTVIHVAGSLTDSTTPLLYADKAHLFERAGLNVQVERFTTGASIATAVSGGTLEIGQFNMFGLVLAHGRGLPFSLIAPGSEYRSDAPDGGLLVLTNSPLHSAKDFNGKTIGALSLQDLSTFAVESWIDANGGDSKTLRFVEVPQPLVMPALEQGRVDAASASQPIFDEATGSGRFRVAAYTQSSIAPRWQATAWYARTDWIDKHRALVQKFIAVMHEANVYVNGHPSETLPLIAAYLGVDPASIAHIHRAAEAEYLNPRSIQPVIDVAAKYKAIPTAFRAARDDQLGGALVHRTERMTEKSAFDRHDESPDELFYRMPRFVEHIDDAAIADVVRLHRERLPAGGAILDLMSSWVSHLPDDVAYARVVGVGMNAAELARNPRLGEYVVHDLNAQPQLPFADASFDAATICVSIQYLTSPFTVLRDLRARAASGRPGDRHLFEPLLSDQGDRDLAGARRRRAREAGQPLLHHRRLGADRSGALAGPGGRPALRGHRGRSRSSISRALTPGHSAAMML